MTATGQLFMGGDSGLPHGTRFVTLVFTDLVGATQLKQELGDREGVRLVQRYHSLVRELLVGFIDAQEIKTAGDSFFIVFTRPSDAARFALLLQSQLRALSSQFPRRLEDRIGIHVGEVVVDKARADAHDLHGMQVDICARVMSLAQGNQILLTRTAFDNARQALKGDDVEGLGALSWLSHGLYRVKGVAEPLEICEVGETGASVLAPPPTSEKAQPCSGIPEGVSSSTSFFTLPPPAAPPPVEDVGKSDVFVSYAQVDDQPLLPGRSGWVSQFHRNLGVRLEQLSGERIKIWPHANRSGHAPIDDRILDRLPDVKTLVSIVSPPFAKSDSCRSAIETFYRAAQQSGDWRVDNKTRLFKVVKTPVDLHELPEPLSALFQQLLSFDFFELDSQTGKLREFSEEFGESARRQFLEKIYDLAYEINQVIRSLKTRSSRGRGAAALPHVGKAVYLAETTSDLRPERDQIRRELLERGFQVLPDTPLPLVASELTDAVRRHLARSSAVIHLVGPRYGMVPEGCNESLAEFQTRLSAENVRKIARFIWTPPGLITDDDRQVAFLRSLREGVEGMQNTELLTGSIEQVKGLVIKHLTAPPPEVKAPVTESEGSLRRVYLICDSKDERGIEPIEDFLYDQGFEVKIPIFDGDEQSFVRIHQENLKSCDGAIIYFGEASAQWVEMKLMDLLKAQGYGREKPWLAQAVYIAPPEHRRKERFRSHQVEVIKEAAGFRPGLLQTFISNLNAAGIKT